MICVGGSLQTVYCSTKSRADWTNQGYKPFSGEFDVQHMEQLPTYRAVSYALETTLNMFLSSLRTSVDGFTWKRFGRGAWFMLRFSALCMVFSLAISWLEMEIYRASFSNEFMGMYLVVGFMFGQFSCALAFPANVLIYLKAPRSRVNRYAVSASLVASICVWLFFYALRGDAQ